VPRPGVQKERPAIAPATPRRARCVALVADDGPRERVGEILKSQRLEFATFDELAELLTHERQDEFDAVAMWVADPVTSLARHIETVRSHAERIPIVMICADIQRWELRTALAAGIAGVVLEAAMAATLGACLRAVKAGQICVPRQHWRQIEPPALSTREKQILGLVVMGYMNSQIAERLFLAESTVKSHLSSAFGKLGVRSRNEAVKLILDSERGFGMGILGLGGERLQPTTAGTQ
jgi:DNA-binding NarL/FixJ family response regulator